MSERERESLCTIQFVGAFLLEKRRSWSDTSTRLMVWLFGTLMAIQCILTSKGLVTKGTGIRFDTQMKLLMSVPVVLPSEPFGTVIASVGPFCVVRASVGLEVVRSCERLLAARIVALVRRVGFFGLLLLRLCVVIFPRLSSSGRQVQVQQVGCVRKLLLRGSASGFGAFRVAGQC